MDPQSNSRAAAVTAGLKSGVAIFVGSPGNWRRPGSLVKKHMGFSYWIMEN